MARQPRLRKELRIPRRAAILPLRIASPRISGMTSKNQTEYLRGLNPEQYRAATHADGPVLVLAGAGSGKTKTLVHRVVHLIRGRGECGRRASERC